MITQSDKAMAAWRATERVLDAVVTINKTDYKTSDIVSIEYDSGGYTGDTFGIGSNYENDVTIKFAHLVEGLKQGMEVTPKIGIKTSNGYEYSSLGVFIISDEITMDRNNDETSIKCYDRMCLLEGNYTSKLSYPAKVVDVIAEIANMAGAPLNTADIGRLPVLANLPRAIKEQTYRNAIGLIAQFYAGFATFSRDGKLTIRTIAEPDYTLDPSQYEQGGLTKNEAPYTIGGIQCEVTTTTTDSAGDSTDTTKTLQIGSTSGSQIKLTNDLMTADRMQTIWDAIGTLNFYPFSLNWFGNPAIEAGDWLTLQDTKGNKFNVPNNGYTMTFDGSLSAVSKADQTATASSSYVWKGELSQYVQALGGRQSATGNYIYGADTLYPPTDAKINDIWYKQNGNKIELWTFERQADGTGKWVLTISDSTGEEIKQQVDSAVAETAKVAETANSAVAGANAAVAKAGFASDAASQAKSAAAIAGSDAKSALTSANSAVVTAGTASNNAQAAYSKAGDALVSAGQALGQSNTALATANGAVGDVKLISETITQLKGGSTLSIAELENGMQSKVSLDTFNGLSVGGTNLLRNGDFSNGLWCWSVPGNSSVNTVTIETDTDGSKMVHIHNVDGNSSGIYNYSPVQGIQSLIVGDDWVATAKFKGHGHILSFGMEHSKANQASDSKSSFDVDSDDWFSYPLKGQKVSTGGGFVMYANSGDVYIKLVKVARGTMVTDWSPAIDDLATSLALGDVKTTLTSQATTLQQTQGLLAAKADSVTVDGLRQTLSQTTATATATAKAMEAKVDSSVVDHLNSLVTKNINDISLTTAGMALKADVTVVNDLKKTVDSNSIAIGVANGQLALKAESSRVDALNKTVATNTADILANSKLVQSKLSQETFDNMQIGGTNWARHSQISTYGGAVIDSYDESTDIFTVTMPNPPGIHGSGIGNNGRKDKTIPWGSYYTYSIEVFVTESGLRWGCDPNFYPIPGTAYWQGNDNDATSLRRIPSNRDLIANQWNRISVTIVNLSGLNTGRVDICDAGSNFQVTGYTGTITVKFRHFQSELGNQPTDYRPAPEDQATNTALNTLSGKVTTQSSLLQQTQTALLGKTDVSVVNALTKTVQSNTNQIGVNSQGLALKSNQSTVDTLTGRVTTAEGKMTVFGTQIQQAVTKTDLTTTLGGYATQSWTSGQIGTAADAVNISVAKVQSNLDGLVTGAPNLLQNTSAFVNTDHWSNGGSLTLYKHDYWKNATENILKLTTDGTAEVYLNSERIKVVPGETYFVQFDGFHNYTVSSVDIWFLGRKTGSANQYDIPTLIKGGFHLSTSNSVHTAAKFTMPTTVDEGYIRIDNNGSTVAGTNADLYVTDIKLAQENQASPYAPAPSDSATVTQVSDLQVTLNGLQGTVTNEVSGLKAQQTLLAGQYTSVIGGLSNENLIPYSGYFSDLTGWSMLAWGESTAKIALIKHSFYHNGQDNTIGLTVFTTQGKSMQSLRFPVQRNTKYTFQFKGFASSNVVGTRAYLISRAYGSSKDYDDSGIHLIIDKIVMSPNHIDTYKATFTTGSTDDEGYIRFDNLGSSNGASASIFIAEIKMELGDVATPYTRSSGSELMQTQEDINARVTKGSLMSQINMDAGHVLIQSNKLYLDAASVVFSGKAFIPAAQITDLRADYIKAGTLDGTQVNVINLNAAAITTGVIHGTNLDINLNTGMVEFQQGRIHSANNNIDVNIDSGYLSVADSKSRILLKGGSMQFVAPNMFDLQSTPYLKISNSGGSASFSGANFIGRDYAVFTNSSNATNIFGTPIGLEDFSGISTGKSDARGWQATKIGGANRGVIISGGAQTTAASTMTTYSPHIFVGSSDGVHLGGNSIWLRGEYVHIEPAYFHTTSMSPNLVVTDNGSMFRSTSASKYKTNIVRGFSTEYGEKLTSLPQATWVDKASLARYNEDPEHQPVPGINYGMIAEDLAAAGLEHLVVRNQNGGLEGIQYDRIAVALLPLIKKQQEEINDLKQKLEAS